jgi:membrane-associated protease RseP (regulator of RpoE activity)
MQMKNKRVVFIVVGLLLAVGLVVGGAVASVFAYRQFVGREEPSLSLSLREGVLVQDMLQSQDGVLVLEVDADGPAAAAGLRHGSIILEVDGVEVNGADVLRDAISQQEAGETVTMTVVNDGETQEIEVTLGSSGPYLGVTVGDESGRFGGERFGAIPEIPPHALPPGFPEQRSFPDIVPGIMGAILVLQLEPESPAEAAGLEPGDILTEMDGQPIEDRDSFVEQVGGKKPGETVDLTVRRGADELSVSVTLAEHPDDPERGFLGIRVSPARFNHEFFSEPGSREDFFEGLDQRRG